MKRGDAILIRAVNSVACLKCGQHHKRVSIPDALQKLARTGLGVRSGREGQGSAGRQCGQSSRNHMEVLRGVFLSRGFQRSRESMSSRDSDKLNPSGEVESKMELAERRGPPDGCLGPPGAGAQGGRGRGWAIDRLLFLQRTGGRGTGSNFLHGLSRYYRITTTDPDGVDRFSLLQLEEPADIA